MQDTTENHIDIEDGVDDDSSSAGTAEPVQCVPTLCNEIDNNQVPLNSNIIKLKSKVIHCYNKSWKQLKETYWYVDPKLIDLIISRNPPFPSRIFLHSWLNNNIGFKLEKSKVKEFLEKGKAFLKPVGI